MRADPLDWQLDLLQKDYDLFDGLPVDETVFTDTSFIETIVFSKMAGIDMGPGVTHWLDR